MLMAKLKVNLTKFHGISYLIIIRQMIGVPWIVSQQLIARFQSDMI